MVKQKRKFVSETLVKDMATNRDIFVDFIVGMVIIYP